MLLEKSEGGGEGNIGIRLVHSAHQSFVSLSGRESFLLRIDVRVAAAEFFKSIGRSLLQMASSSEL